MGEISRAYIDSYNYLTLSAEESAVDVANNTSTVHVWLDLWVTGHVSSSNIRVNVTGGQESNLGYQYYGSGGHRLKEAYFTANHNPDGSGSARVEGYFAATIGTWGLSGTLGLTKINRTATINSFTGTNISGDFKATYTSYGSYRYKLRISIPNVIALDTYDNYSSGQAVKLSENSINYIKDYTNKKTIVLGGVIETWSGNTKIGESSEINITCEINKPMHVMINGEWKDATPYVGVNGQWKEAVAYVGVNNQWKEGI